MSDTVTSLLLRYWQMTDRHRADLAPYADAYGDTDDSDEDFADAQAEAAAETHDFLTAAMEELAEHFPLPAGLSVAVPGANGARFSLITGQLDDHARKAFTRGQCHALARALAEVTGWPMAVLITPDCVYDPDECSADDDAYAGLCACRFHHVVVVRPDGALVDAYGAHQPDAVPAAEGYRHIPLNETGWTFLANSPAWRRPAVAVARTFTTALLAELDTTR
ncbi:hypothetical protein SAM9427_37025 (plasmid) [Streptomyces sp. ETH9427]|uniref:hypothetical protein n=1 Tax=Streptomyces sp. E1N211 TaxID=1851876 RepID=UPI000E0B5AF7|nr:hypothetical protein [Streptomyces sp. E1N211]AXI91372.1 hypothetical protein SAM9427_37025 [Streptomyces sp. ETH9427]